MLSGVKNPPFTRLETLSRRSIWLVTCWPFLLALVVMLIDTSSHMHKEILTFSPTQCSSPLQCYVSSTSGTGRSITFTMPTQALLLHYVNLLGRIKVSVPLLNEEEEEGSGAEDPPTSNRVNPVWGIKKMSKDIVIHPASASAPQFGFAGEAGSSNVDYEFELGSAAMERPWLLPESRTLQGEISISVSALSSSAAETETADTQMGSDFNENSELSQMFAHSILLGSSFDFEYQRLLFSFVRALLQLAGAFFTFVCLMDFVFHLDRYHRLLHAHSLLLPLNKSRTDIAIAPSNSSQQTSSLQQHHLILQAESEAQDNANNLSRVVRERDSVECATKYNELKKNVFTSGSSTSGAQEDLEAQRTGDARGDRESRSGAGYCCLSYFLAEQIYTVQLLVFLFFWMDPLGALVLLAPLVAAVDISETALWVTALMKCAAQQGLFFTLLLFITSLGTVSSFSSGAATCDEAALQRMRLVEEERLLSGRPSATRSRPSSGSSERPQGGKEQRRASRGATESGRRRLSGSSSRRSVSPPPPSHLPAWVFETDSSDCRDTARYPGTLYPGARCDSFTSSEDDQQPDWLHSPTSVSEDDLSRAYVPGNHFAADAPEPLLLCRTYIDVVRGQSACDLIESHPCSSKYLLSYLSRKLLAWLACLAVVLMQVSATFPTLFSKIIKLSPRDGDSALLVERFLFVIFSALLVFCQLTWIYSIYQAVVSSSVTLKETKYMTARYQQLAFRLFVNQILVGLVLLLLSYVCLVVRSVLVLYDGCLHEVKGRASLSGLLHHFYLLMDASFEGGFGVWGGKNSEIGELLYVACICYTIAFLFSPPKYENMFDPLDPKDEKQRSQSNIQQNIYLQANHGLVGQIYQYDVLDTEQQQDEAEVAAPCDRRLFCLETSLLLMECTWQAYYAAPVPAASSARPRELSSTRVMHRQASALGKDETQPLLSESSRLSTGSYLPNFLGRSAVAEMNISQYGLTLIESFCNEEGDISGYVAIDEYHISSARIILAFRGTIDSSNLLTDLNILQSSLHEDSLNLSSSWLEELVGEVLAELTGGGGGGSPVLRHGQILSGNVNSMKKSSNPFDINYESYDDGDGVRVPPAGKACSTKVSLPSDSQKHIASAQSLNCLKCLSKSDFITVHTGFYQAYLSIRLAIFKAIIAAVVGVLDRKTRSKGCINESSPNCPPLDIFICGHSLGGALASLASLDLSLNGELLLKVVQKNVAVRKMNSNHFIFRPRLLVFTYGSPRVGNRAFAQWVEKKVPNIFRIEVDGDLICRLPHKLYTCGNYHHVGTHVLVAADETGNLVINPNVVESQLLRRGRGTTSYHGLTNYRACIEACFSSLELEFYNYKYYLRGKHKLKVREEQARRKFSASPRTQL